MKSRIVFIFLLLIVFQACRKEADLNETIRNRTVASKKITPDQMHDALSKVLSLALNDKNVRWFLHSEINKQFTCDFDILYDIIKGKEVESEKYGVIRFSELLDLTAHEAKIDFSPFEDEIPYRNLQISSPVYFGEWDPENSHPLVISLPVGYQEGEGELVRAFDRFGNESMVSEDALSGPFLLVRQAERVDAEGMMRVDPDGFVIPENERIVSAMEAYDIASQRLKSGAITKEDPVIEVLDSETFEKALQSRRSENSAVKRASEPTGIPFQPVLKSATTLEPPGNLRVHPDGPCSIKINWSQVVGAVAYEVFRQFSFYENYLIATLNDQQQSYIDFYVSSGIPFTYSVRAVDIDGNRSLLTDGLESYGSWRRNGNRDYIDKIYIDSECWNWCCGLFDGKIELQYKTSYLSVSDNYILSYPSFSDVNNLGQKTKDQQKGKWCTYNHCLFPWDVRYNSYSYRFKLVEDDGAGNGITIKLGSTFKVQFLKIIDYNAYANTEFKIADKDEEFGEVIILYWEGQGGPAGSDGYNLIPDKGNARMYLKQY